MAWQPGRRQSLIVAMVLIVALGLGAGYTVQSLRLRLREQARREPSVPGEVRAAGSNGGVVQASVPVVTPATRLVVRTTYLKCDKTVEENIAPEEALVGLSIEGLRRFRPEWTVIDFTPERVLVRAIKDEWCPGMDPAEMERYRTIGMRDGKVTIFWGKPSPDQPVKEVTTFPSDGLPPEERRLLEQGYVVDGDEAVAQYLEGLAE